jgi:hypothetical protein
MINTTALTMDQSDFVRRCFKRWAELNPHSGTSYSISFADMDHSALLDRLLLGLPVYKFPPPRAMSYPWYDLMSGEECKNNTVHFYAPEVTINQSGWKLESINEAKTEFEASYSVKNSYMEEFVWRVKGTKQLPEYGIPEWFSWTVILLTPAEQHQFSY